MKKLRVIFLIPLMLLGAFLVPSLAHAATGVVSVNGGALVQGSAPPSTVSVPIQISGSDPLNGFDIQVKADPAVLHATGVSLTGSDLGANSVVVLLCIDGVLIAGTTCSLTDTVGVIHFAATEALGAALAPGTGLLFTINYNVVGSSTASPISFQTGCTGTSVSTGACVTVANGGATPLSETTQAGTFANLIDFTITTDHPQYSTPASTPINVGLTYNSLGGYQDILTESYAVSPAGPTCIFSIGQADLTVGTTATDTLACSGAVGVYSVTVTAAGQGIFSPPQPLLTHTKTFSLTITPADFSVALSQSQVTVSRGSTDSSTTVNLSGIGGFSGTVSFTAASSAGITGSAPMATLTNDGSGYSTATSTLTVSVANTVATASYLLTVTGVSGSISHSATIMVNVPGQDFSIFAVPNNIAAIRGGTVALDLEIHSIGNLAGTASFTATVSPVAGQIDNGCPGTCPTNNIATSFLPATATLTSGGSLEIGAFAATVGGDAAIASNTATATGFYTATITATIAGVVHSVGISFNVEDFTIGPAYCTGTNFIQATPNGLIEQVLKNTTPTGGDVAGVLVGTPCNSLTITDQPNILTPYLGIFSPQAQILWVQTNVFGGFTTDGFNGLPSVSALNGALPFNGITVPQMAAVFGAASAKACMVPTFWPNGTQIPYSYLAQNGPLILPNAGFYPFLAIIGAAAPGTSNWGCKFDSAAYPHDVGVSGEFNGFENSCAPHMGCYSACPPSFSAATPCDYQNFNNPDFWGVTAMALQGTLPGDYTFQQCANNGAVQHCQTYTLHVLSAPLVHQLVVKKSVSFSLSGGSIPFKIGLSNPSSHTIYAVVTVTGIGSFGDTFTASSSEVTIAPGAAANNIALSAPLSASEIGETFTFSFAISVGTDPVNLDGSSTEQSIQQTIHVTA